MDFWTGLAVYIIIWWLVIFMVLPWGVRQIDPDDLLEGEDPGAPAKPRMVLKLAITTGISGVVFVLVHLIIQSGVSSFRV